MRLWTFYDVKLSPLFYRIPESVRLWEKVLSFPRGDAIQ